MTRINERISASHASEAAAQLLRLDCTKAHQELSWYPVWNTQAAIEQTIDWYRAFYEQNTLNTPTDLSTYVDQARNANLIWTQ